MTRPVLFSLWEIKNLNNAIFDLWSVIITNPLGTFISSIKDFFGFQSSGGLFSKMFPHSFFFLWYPWYSCDVSLSSPLLLGKVRGWRQGRWLWCWAGRYDGTSQSPFIPPSGAGARGICPSEVIFSTVPIHNKQSVI